MSDYLPQSILIEILLRLPVKSLVRFTLVSKTWRAFITSPDFIATHLSRVQYPTYNNRSRNFLIRYYSELDGKEHYELCTDNSCFLYKSLEIKFPLKSREGFFNQIVGSCNGIICLCDNLFGNCFTSPIILWNPSIQYHFVLPLPTDALRTECFVLGFGFDWQRNDYKVLRLLCRKGIYRKPVEFEVFSLRDKSWKGGKPLALKGFINDIGQSQVYFNGNVHWMAFQYKDDGDVENSILEFDCSDDEFIETLLPDNLANLKLNPNLHLIVHEGRLGMISYNMSFCSIWEMKEHGYAESWTRLYYLEWIQLYRVPLDKGMAKVVGFRQNGQLLVTVLADRNVSQRADCSRFGPALGGLVSYNRTTRQVSEDPRHLGWIDSFHIIDYVETLSMLDDSCIHQKELADHARLETLSLLDDSCIRPKEVADHARLEATDDGFEGEADEGVFQRNDFDEFHDFGGFDDDKNDDGYVCPGEIDVYYEAADDTNSDDSWVFVSEKDLQIPNAKKND